jgi:hypothetical protein
MRHRIAVLAAAVLLAAACGSGEESADATTSATTTALVVTTTATDVTTTTTAPTTDHDDHPGRGAALRHVDRDPRLAPHRTRATGTTPSPASTSSPWTTAACSCPTTTRA